MPVNDVLTPLEASYIATNSYFTLKDWMKGEPKAGMESHANVRKAVTGPGVGAGPVNTTLKGTDLSQSKVARVFSGTTGMGTSSGFGYVLKCRKGDRRHAIIATRGTRPEMKGMPDLITDVRGALTGFGDYGPVHKGFKKTFDSVMTGLVQENSAIMDADVVHCVGHSLGGGVATLIAAHYARLGKEVKLYTFGSPRVGAGPTRSAMEREIGDQNIYRTAHDLDPVTLIGPFPYIHTNPTPGHTHNFTLLSPTGDLLSVKNHDMTAYIDSVGKTTDRTWEHARSAAKRVDHDNAVLARWLLHKDNDPGWVQYASAKTLGILFKLFSHVLKTVSTSLILGLTAVDLLAEIIHNGLSRMAALSAQVFELLRLAARWARIEMRPGAEFTAQIIKRILDAMMARLNAMAAHALVTIGHELTPLPLIVAGGWLLSGGSAI